ncbi:MAG: hypothetical protein JNN07_11725 [Verrucomicrobiales bacterium]|nr:hypothetical protein [Verrucomicrobiales bacterium]
MAILVNQEHRRLGALPAALAAAVLCVWLSLLLTPIRKAQGQSVEPPALPLSAPQIETAETDPAELDPLAHLLPSPPAFSHSDGLVSPPEEAAGPDLPPQLKRANLVPGIVDITSGNRNVMAIAEVGLNTEIRGVTFHLSPRDSDDPPILSIAGTLISTTPTIGRWEALLTIPKGCLPGRWALAVLIQPLRGNPMEFGLLGHTPLPPNSARELLVVNQGDIDSSLPEVEILKVDPQLAFVGCGDLATPVKIRLRVKASSGLDDTESSFVQLSRSNLASVVAGEVLSEANRISGTAVDGIYEAIVPIQPNSEPGEFIAGAMARSRVGRSGKMVRPGPKVHVRSLKHLPPGYIDWATRNFPGSFPDPDCQFHALWRPDADIDGDGVMNCVEAYFGTSPTNQADAPKILVSYDSKRQFVVSWTQPQSTYGMAVKPEWSSDLDLWFASGESFAGRKARTISVSDEGPAPKGGVFKEARFDVNGLPHAYLRLRVLMP